MRFLPAPSCVLAIIPALFVCASVFGQAAKPPAAVPSFADESFVVERAVTRVAMQADGTGYLEREIVLRVQSEAALKEASVISVPFASASERVDMLYARARRPDGSVVETPVDGAIEQPQPVTREAPFYSDLKVKQLPVKSLRVGDTLEWKARSVRTKAEAPGQFWGQEIFAADFVTLSQLLELRVPRGLAVTVWTNPRGTPKPVETDEGAEHVYRWDYSNLKPNAGPEAEAAKLAKKKKLLTADEELDNREGVLPSVAWTTFKSWQAVGEWYESLERGRVIPDDTIKARVAELTAGKTTDEAKARAVYSFVAPQIRYIGVSFGVGRYQPHRASEVLENQYGDCKDKHTLLAAMLTAIGLHPQAVLIGAQIRFNEAVPSPGAFNHLITKVEIDGKPVWLDATQEIAPYRALLYPLRDKAALVIPETGPAVVEHTPAALPFASTETMNAVGTLDKDGLSKSRITFTMRGDDEMMVRSVLRQVPPASYGELAQKMSEGMGYAGTASNPDFGRPEETSDALTFSYDYKREKGGDWDHYRIIPQLKYASLPRFDEKEPPVSSIELGVPRTETSSSAMTLPVGWGAELPEAIHAKSDFATLDTTYRFDHGTVYADRRTVVLKERLPASDWKAYKKWTDDAQLGQEEYIQLTRTGAAATALPGKGSGAGVTALGPSNAEAGKLVAQAFEALEARDFGKAQTLLDKAKDLNGTQKNLNGAYAALDYDRGEMKAASTLYLREVTLHPDSTWVYAPLARSLDFTKHHAEALEALRAWGAADPASDAAAVALAGMLMDDDDAAGAVGALNATIKLEPADEPPSKHANLRLTLGRAELQAGMDTRGAATLAAILNDADLDDPLMLNNAAYELANAGKDLPLAEAAERRALDKLTAESRSWTLNEKPDTLKAKSSLLVSSWDTLGWILFKEAKYQDAEDLVHAAWLNHPVAEVGLHLGQIEEALDNKPEALRAYTLASADRGFGKLADQRAKDLKARMEALKKAGVKTGGINADGALQFMRTFQLGPAHGRDGAAEYLLQIAKDRIVKAQPAGTKQLTGGTDLIEKLSFMKLVPAMSEAQLVKGAILNCHAGNCELVMEP